MIWDSPKAAEPTVMVPAELEEVLPLSSALPDEQALSASNAPAASTPAEIRALLDANMILPFLLYSVVLSWMGTPTTARGREVFTRTSVTRDTMTPRGPTTRWMIG